MSGFEAGAVGFVALMVVLVFRVPIGLAMFVVGAIGYVAYSGAAPLLNYLKTAGFWRFSTYDFSVVPLFMLMGQFATKAGLSQALFRAAYAGLGHRPGGIAMATIGACAGFGTICGSSLATAATMAHVALPELRRYKYSGALATGTLAAGGTLGILIPPSIVLVIYAIMVEANIAHTFLAGFVPGILAAIGYVIAIAVHVRLRPLDGPAGPPMTRAEKLRAVGDIWPVATIFVLVIGGIYVGWFTPTEGAAVGAGATGVIAFASGAMRWAGFVDSLMETATATGMIFLIVLGADVFGAFLALTRMPFQSAELISGSGLPPLLVLLLMVAIYLCLGCIMDSLSMILLTIPIFWPIVAGLDFGLAPEETKLWFGIIVLMVVEMGLITPPIGLNVFVINAIAGDVPMLETFRGVVPYLVSDAVRLALLIAFPALALSLPRLA
jgi:tripartite ATP-independent transporter DctM subunit